MPLEDVITTAELDRRPARAPDFESESRALVGLMRALREADANVLQQLAETALDLCRAQSAGVSIEEEEHGQGVPLAWRRRSVGPICPVMPALVARSWIGTCLF